MNAFDMMLFEKTKKCIDLANQNDCTLIIDYKKGIQIKEINKTFSNLDRLLGFLEGLDYVSSQS